MGSDFRNQVTMDIKILQHKMLEENYDDRREWWEGKGKREPSWVRVLKSLDDHLGDSELYDYWLELQFCRNVNLERFKPETKRFGPYFNRMMKYPELEGWEQTKYKDVLREVVIDSLTSLVDEDGKPDKKRINKYLQQQKKVVKGKKEWGKRVCQSLWCPFCRKVASETYLSRVYDHLNRKTYKDITIDQTQIDDVPKYTQFKRDYTNNDLNMITGHIGLCPVDYDQLDKMIKKDDLKWRSMRKWLEKNTTIKREHDPFVEVVYEFELVNRKFLMRAAKGSEFKRKQINQMLKRDRVKGEVFLYVHFHGLTNLDKPQIRELFGDRYFVDGKPLIKNDKECGLYIRALEKDKPFLVNIQKICSYPFKDPVRFKHTFIGSDFSNGEFYTPEEMKNLYVIYKKIQGRSWRRLFRSISLDVVKTIDKFSDLYGDTKHGVVTDRHEVWGIMDNVVVVDTTGTTYLSGWNPDSHPVFEGKKTLRVFENIVDRKATKRQWFYHPHYKEKGINLVVYKNQYDYQERVEAKLVNFEEYFGFRKVKGSRVNTEVSSNLLAPFKNFETQYAKYKKGDRVIIEVEEPFFETYKGVARFARDHPLIFEELTDVNNPYPSKKNKSLYKKFVAKNYSEIKSSVLEAREVKEGDEKDIYEVWVSGEHMMGRIDLFLEDVMGIETQKPYRDLTSTQTADVEDDKSE